MAGRDGRRRPGAAQLPAGAVRRGRVADHPSSMSDGRHVLQPADRVLLAGLARLFPRWKRGRLFVQPVTLLPAGSWRTSRSESGAAAGRSSLAGATRFGNEAARRASTDDGTFIARPSYTASSRSEGWTVYRPLEGRAMIAVANRVASVSASRQPIPLASA